MVADVAIIGAGYAGLACAVTLARAGIRATLYEAGPLPGGRARRIHNDPDGFDNGQHILLGAYEALLGMMETVAPGSSATRIRRLPLAVHFLDGFDLQTPRLPAPFHLAAGLLSARGLRLRDKGAALAFAGRISRLRGSVAESLTVAQLLAQQHQSSRASEALWIPLCLAALNTSPDHASARQFLAVLDDSFNHRRADSDFLLPLTDLTELFPAPAMRWLESHGTITRLAHRIRRIVPQDQGFLLEGPQGVASCQTLVLAVGPHQLDTLARGALAPLAQSVGHFHYEAITTIYLRYAGQPRLPFPVLGWRKGPVDWVFDRGALGGPPQLACVKSAALPGGDQATLIRQADAAVRAFLPLPDLLGGRVITEKRATYSARAGIARPGVRTAVPGCYLAGDYLDGPYPATLEAAVRSGIECAQTLIKDRLKQ